MTNNCPICGKDFIPAYHLAKHQIYCNKYCRQAATPKKSYKKAIPLFEKKCIVYSKEFRTNDIRTNRCKEQFCKEVYERFYGYFYNKLKK